ncbi:hypothetical protein OC844_007283 [Tilletia horrida]|nr:hypothetical protein OC844_007283 [Tilletia horrida]
MPGNNDNPPAASTPPANRTSSSLTDLSDMPPATPRGRSVELPEAQQRSSTDDLLHRILDEMKVITPRLQALESWRASADAPTISAGPTAPSMAHAPTEPLSTSTSAVSDAGGPTSVSAATLMRTSSAPASATPATPPHMLLPDTSVSDSDAALTTFQQLSPHEKDLFRAVLRRFGTNIHMFLDHVPPPPSSANPPSALPPSSASDANMTVGPPPTAAPRAAIAPATSPAPAVTAIPLASSATPAAPTSYAVRTLNLEPKYVRSYDGDPARLEEWLSHIRNHARADDHPSWFLAIMRTLPSVLKDNAAEWHESLTNGELKDIDSYEKLADAMREAFPINRSQLRRLARDRHWEPARETAVSFCHRKVRLMRSAFGKDAEVNLVLDVLDGLPASLRVLLRLPRLDATLQDVRLEVTEWEPLWRHLHPAEAAAETITVPSAVPSLSTPSTTSASTSARVSPTVAAAALMAPRTSGVQSQRPSQTAQRQRQPLGATYEPKNVIPAADGKARRYRRPDTGEVIELSRPCWKCKGDHFDFEHDKLPAAQLRTMESEDDYPVVEAAPGDDDGAQDLSHF